ncbi:MAG: 4Fe-4S binding protein [Methanosarcina thermophila]|jgi:NAD-dependent dihydropyrimidine dehydrogenase PreA subunit|uniref:Probable ferredoxin n=4 Tax=Methanosarcina thermophila TaxID=2210 RepID=FER_METTE|nr:4Fe-4S binding protein [Methanosarcina thermophila]Q01700.1 RecName: Full=Probable ferredoxin [Methanosarcina thermophila]ALK05275.1 MAG: ferredoxin [Methanosarcina sp. 795]AAA73172.1 ferredoxin [Methanosarcina thermophila TM-1]AKB14049.1 Ferredoxin [Methanosarcina thermophila TM-1]AKB15308.1 Ferredoxin [Methanosarcina thermophila CHTI-55]NLU56230.1 4Fe-4S binding protein [Methanosarcina thermophila]
MVAKVNVDLCTGCGSCVDECPAAAISLNDDGIATVDESECLDCGSCEDACPNNAITIE